MRTLSVHFGCNNPHTGQMMERCARFDLDGELSIESSIMKEDDLLGPKIDRGLTWVRVHRRKFVVVGWDYWVGNWCWDVARMRPADAASLLSYLRTLKISGHPWFSVDQGAESLFDLWLSKKEITSENLLEAIQNVYA